MPILHTSTSGKGPIIIMMHGFLASSAYFNRFRKRFEQDYTVVTVDLLGSGKSARPNDPVTYESQIEALHDTFQQFSPPFILLGHSMGAVLATRYATEFPEEVSSLILFNPPLFASKDQAKTSIESTGFHYRAALVHPRSRLLWKSVKLLPRIPQAVAPPINLGNSLNTHHHAREGGYQNVILQAEFIHDLATIPQPTLLVTGDRDRYVYKETLNTLTIPPHVTVTRVTTGHHTIVTKPDLAEELTRKQLKSLLV